MAKWPKLSEGTPQIICSNLEPVSERSQQEKGGANRHGGQLRETATFSCISELCIFKQLLLGRPNVSKLGEITCEL